MQIDQLLKVDGHDGSVGFGLAFDPTHGGTHYRLVVFDNAEGVITRLDRLIPNSSEAVRADKRKHSVVLATTVP